MREDDIALLKRGFDAFAKGDLATVREMASEDGVWRTPGHGLFEAEYKGPDGTVAYLTKLFEESGGTFKTEPLTFMADDEGRVMVLEHVTAQRGEKMLDAHVVHVFEVRDGKVVDTTEFVSEPDKVAAFWL